MTQYGPSGWRGRSGDPFAAMRQDFARMIDEFGRFAQAAPAAAAMRMGGLRADMSETDDALEIEIDAPGVRPDGLDITLREDALSVRIARAAQRHDHDRNWHVRERAQSSSTRTIVLPFTPAPDAVTATLEHGILRIRVDKGREADKRAVKIRVEGAGGPGRDGRNAQDPAI